MTTIPGHNQVLQQSGIAQELSQQVNSPKPDQAAVIQQAQEVLENSTIQGSDESERLKREKEQRKRRLARKAEKRKKKEREKEMATDPETKGRLLDTTA